MKFFTIIICLLCISSVQYVLCQETYFDTENAQHKVVIITDTSVSSSTIQQHFDQPNPTTTTTVILKADANGNCKYEIDSGLVLGSNDILVLDYGVWLVRKSNSSYTDPIVTLHGINASLSGVNRNLIVSHRNGLSDGIVKIGQTSSTDETNVISCKISNIRISGSFIKGNGPDGNVSSYDDIVGLHIYGNEGLVANGDTLATSSYFHTVRDVDIYFANTGILIDGSNANTIDNILLNRTSGVNYENKGIGIYIKDALENKISNVFHHTSKYATSINFTYTRFKPVYNSISNFVVETGGPSETLEAGFCIEMDNPNDIRRNFIQINCNNSAVFPTGAYDNYFNENNKNVLLGTEHTNISGKLIIDHSTTN